MEVWNRAQQVEQLCSDLRGEWTVLSALDFCTAAIGYYHNFTGTMGSSYSGFTSLFCEPVLHPLLYFYHVFLRKVRLHVLADLTSHIHPYGSFLLRCDLKCNQHFQLASELAWSFHMHPQKLRNIESTEPLKKYGDVKNNEMGENNTDTLKDCGCQTQDGSNEPHNRSRGYIY